MWLGGRTLEIVSAKHSFGQLPVKPDMRISHGTIQGGMVIILAAKRFVRPP